MKAARIVKPREPLEIKPPIPKGPQVLNKVHSVVICHSDIHLWEGGYEALTSYGAVKNANLAPSDKVVSAGAGGLGLMAIQLAKPATGARIIAMDLDDEKLKLVKQNRTDNNINSKNEDAANVVIELSNKLGADAVIDFVNVSKTVETDTQLLRRRAKLVLVGLLDYELKQNLITISSRAYKLIGSYAGSITDLIEIVSLGKRGVIRPIISNRFKLDQATEALRLLKNRKIFGRGIINP